jgi:hypothetical protein
VFTADDKVLFWQGCANSSVANSGGGGGGTSIQTLQYTYKIGTDRQSIIGEVFWCKNLFRFFQIAADPSKTNDLLKKKKRL